MKIIRAVALAVIVSLALLGSFTTVANAEPGTAVLTEGPAVLTEGPAVASSDPGDPGFPPDD